MGEEKPKILDLPLVGVVDDSGEVPYKVYVASLYIKVCSEIHL